MNLQKLIRDELERQCLTQLELCRRTGLTESRVSDFLNGKRDVQSRTLTKILLALGIKLTPGKTKGK